MPSGGCWAQPCKGSHLGLLAEGSLSAGGASPSLPPPPSLLAPVQLFQVGLPRSPCSPVPCPALSLPAQPANKSLQHHPPTAGHTLAPPESYGNRLPPQGTLDTSLEPSRGCKEPSEEALQSNLRMDFAAQNSLENI